MSNPTTADLLAYWSMDEESGNRIDEVAGLVLTDNNTVTYDTGIKGNAADFTPGNSEYLSIEDTAAISFGDEDFTICFWAKFNALGANRELVCKWDQSNNDREYRIFYADAVSDIRFTLSPDGSSATNLDLNITEATGTWYFVCAWYSTADNKMYMSVNDANEVNTSHNGGSNDNISTLAIGARDDAGSVDNYHDGLIDEVAFFGRVLTGAEQEWLYNSGAGRTYDDILGFDNFENWTEEVGGTGDIEQDALIIAVACTLPR